MSDFSLLDVHAVSKKSIESIQNSDFIFILHALQEFNIVSIKNNV